MAIVAYRRLTLKMLRFSDWQTGTSVTWWPLQNPIHSRPSPSLCELKFAAESNNHQPQMILAKLLCSAAIITEENAILQHGGDDVTGKWHAT